MKEIVLMDAAFTPEMVAELREMAEARGYRLTELDFGGDYPPDRLRDCEILCGHCPEVLLKEAASLRWLQLTSAGVDRMTDRSLYPHDHVTVTNATGVFGVSIAEHMLMGTLMLLRRMPVYFRQQLAGSWQRAPGLRLLYGRRVAVFGTGDLGGTFARYCRCLGASVVGLSRSGREKPDFDRVYPVSQWREALTGAEIVAACLPGTAETRGLITREMLLSLEPGAIFLNTGRGTTVDEAALIDALREGPLSGAALDVFETEPLPAASPLWAMDNVILTPHMSGSGWDSENIHRIFALFRDNLNRYFAGEPLRNVVDLERGY